MKDPSVPLLIPALAVLFSLCILPAQVSSHGLSQHDVSDEDAANISSCGDGWGCLISDCCSASASSLCDVSLQWREEGDAVRFRLRAITKGFIALGISTTGKMDGSEIYSCNSKDVVRGWTKGHTVRHEEVVKNSLSDIKVEADNGYITCEFLRVQTLADANSSFLDISPGNRYTVLAAWADQTDDGYPDYHDQNQCRSERKVDFTTAGSHSAGMESEVLPKLHGILMTIAWLGFAAIGITSSRYYKPIWPESTLWGKPVWFTIHRTCMVSAFICFIAAAIIIVIHVGGYIQQSEGPVRFLHAVFGTMAIILGISNWVMALFRPHPGTPNRPIYDWGHWALGTLAFSLALVTLLLGLADFEGISPLLGGIPEAIFWVAVCFILFHLAIWMTLQYISVAVESTGRDNDLPLVNDDDELEKSPINGNGSMSALDDYDDAFHIRPKDLSFFQQSTKKSARMKQLLFYVYISGVAVAVLVVVIGIIVAKED